ncbi:MAG TPA: response regulator transcription factor [Chitinophagaceae bacterium]|jgi:DNA-binding NarL/FixJ family response regulator|nr:response regulator transcription factor [Chitinophagaceae bacterium]
MNKQITKIALVDDHSLLRGSLASLINSFEGYNVVLEADNGKDFIHQLQQHPHPDIVLLDITMPEMNGFETAAWIKKNLQQTRVLVLSMMDDDTAIIAMLKEGARGYILKDSKPLVFRQALDNIRDKGFFMNELVSNKMLNYVVGDEKKANYANVLTQLTEKETTFLRLACSELTYKEIAAEMGLSPRTVEGYRDELFKKLNVMSRVGLVMLAIKNGLYKL